MDKQCEYTIIRNVFNYVKSERDDISDIENKIDRKCARIFAVK